MTTAAFDTETHLIRPGLQAPPLVCLTSAIPVTGARLFVGDDARRHFEWLLKQDPIYTVNGAFDMCVCLSRWPEFFAQVFEAYDDNRVIDVSLSQRLIDNAEGKMGYFDNLEPNGYSLAGLAKRILKKDRSAEKDDPDAWRTRYSELDGVAAEDYPEAAATYAMADAADTLAIGQHQWLKHRELIKDSPYQAKASFALQLMMCWGVMTDPERIEALRKVSEEMYHKLSRELIEHGLVRKNGTRNVREAQKRMIKVCTEIGRTIKLTATGYNLYRERSQGISVPVASVFNEDELVKYTSVDEDACKESGDDVLMDYSLRTQLHGIVNTHVPDLLRGVEIPIQPRYNTMVESGRTSCSKGKPKKKNAPLTRYGFQFQNPKRALNYFPDGVGIRECFIARPGMLFADNDFSGLELHTGAQACLATVGYSKLAEALNKGVDPHLLFGAQMMGIGYEESVARKHDKDVKFHRQLAKCFHPDTEVLTKKGWVKVSELKGDEEVAAAAFQNGGRTNIRWEKPTRLTTRVAEELVHLKNQSIDLLVTPDHRMAAWYPRVSEPVERERGSDGRMLPQGGKQKQNTYAPVVCTPEELPKKRSWPSAGLCEKGKGGLAIPPAALVTERLLRLAVATQADGNYNGRKIRFGFTKKRKIERLRKLLEGWSYREVRVGVAQVPTFYLPEDLSEAVRGLLDADKTLPWWWLGLPVERREVVLDEVQHWDAHIVPHGRNLWQYTSTIKKNVDVLQAIAAITNRKSSLRLEPRSKPHHKDAHILSVKDRPNTRGGNLEATRVTWGKDVYCLTVPSGAVLVRHGGKTVVTFQCANFGLPGGLGAPGLMGFARGYGVKLTLEQAKKLRDDWFIAWPEWIDYFKFIRGHLDKLTNRGKIAQLYVSRIRGGCSYTSMANTLFQGLGADCSKRALYEVSKRCYVKELGNVLYGARPVGFVHDEILAEVFEEIASEQAIEMANVMVEEANKLLPDVPVRCEPALCKRWSKEVEAVYDDAGRLQPYDLARDGQWKVYYSDGQPVTWKEAA